MNNQETLFKARVISVQKNLYTVTDCNDKEFNEINAKVAGKFLSLNLERPVIGDYVMVKNNPYGDSVIVKLLERKTVFVRPDRSGHADGFVKNLLEEKIVANFDYVFIVSSLNNNFNENRIARYISITLKSGAIPVVILTKADLCPDPELYVQIIYALSDKVKVYAVSSFTGYGIDQLNEYITTDKTIVFLGSSGVGKSTLLNTLIGYECMKVNKIRDSDGKGRHTTTSRELFKLKSGAYIIDTPGLREIGMSDVEEGIDETFSDIKELSCQCKFSNCSHTTEPGCAILQAVADGNLSEERWKTYCNLTHESRWGKEKMKQISRMSKQMERDRYSFYEHQDI